MTEEIDRRFPLSWPAGWPRTRNRGVSRFARNRSFAAARTELLEELARLGAKRIVLSTNVELRLVGLGHDR